MLLPITWKKQALNDRDKIFDFVAKWGATSAILLDDEIEEAPELAQTQPNMHRPGRKTGTREIVVRKSWIIVYRPMPTANPSRLEVLRVLSTRRNILPTGRRVVRKSR